MRLLAVIFALLASMASAGAWPRDKGRWFLATSTQISGFGAARNLTQLELFNNLYLEYGLTQSLTLGLDIGQSIGFDPTYHASDPNYRLFARLPLVERQGSRLAVEASLGKAGDQTYTAVGLNFGRGFTLGPNYGWFSVDTRQVMAEGPGAEFLRQSKLDVTAGLTFASRLKAMAQVFHTQVGPDPYTSFAPSVVLPFGDRLKVQGGLIFDLQEPAPPGVKIGLWQEF